MPTSPASTRRTRSPRGGGAALGVEIVTAALGVVDEHGVPGLTLRGLARSIGVSAPAIYAHFSDLDSVLLAVAERAFADLAETLALAAEGSEPAARLRSIAGAYLEYADQRPGRYQAMFGGQWDATAAAGRGSVGPEAVGELGQDVLQVLSGAVRDRIGGAARVVTAEVPTDALTAWVVLHGYAHQRLVSRSLPWPPAMTEHVLDCVEALVDRTQRAD